MMDRRQGPVGVPLVIRADAGESIGVGHVLRCLALAQAWRDDGGEAIFLSTEMPEALVTRIRAEGLEHASLSSQTASLDDVRLTPERANQLGARWIVVDGYQLGADYQNALKAAGLRVLRIDDLGDLASYDVDIVLNQNINATEAMYSGVRPETRLLLGTRYALLRREFRSRIDNVPRTIRTIGSRILVTLGGSDPQNATLGVMRELERVETPLEVKVIVGPANPNLRALSEAVPNSVHRYELLRGVDDMPGVMAWADVAISAGGSTCWELAFMGLPNLAFVLADNQAGIAAALEAAGVSLNLGEPQSAADSGWGSMLDALVRDPARRSQMSERGRNLVDGQGARRVAALLCGVES